ncbi:DUF6059 family protein [Streptomyces sp. RPT161]|uniref:DUF6059 family protein n=1 Tax=Streptomyces sp. RPT161 TaxID=3015993 RepID=UPI0022B879C2|nr:DUF6059 family protein [Streptomyces sp. RPT161]
MGVSRLVFRCVGRWLALWTVLGAKGVWRVLVEFGEVVLGGFPQGGAREFPHGGAREPLAGPPPGHPERLLPDAPLSAVERELARELAKLCDWLPTRSFR